MWISNHSSFSNFWMSNKSTFYLGSSKVMTRDNNYIIYTASYPVIAILVSFSTITCEIFSIELRKISINKSLMITINSSHLTRPRLRNAQSSFTSSFDFFTIFINYRGLNSIKGFTCRTRF